MDRQSVDQLLLRVAGHARAEIWLAVVIIAVSLLSPTATLSAVIIELLIVFTILLLPVRGNFAILPLPFVAMLILVGFGSHLLLSGLIVCLSIHYAIASGRYIIAAIIAMQWITIAYGVVLHPGPIVLNIPSIIFEFCLLGIAAGSGYLRMQIAAQVRYRDEAQERVEQALQVGLSQHLHDSLARSLTMITVQAEDIEEISVDPIAQQSSRMIAETGRTAIKDLHELMQQLAEADFSVTATIDERNTASINETITSSVYLLETAGFDVEWGEISPTTRIDTAMETAFALVFNEVTANIVKHALRRSKVIITATADNENLFIHVINECRTSSSLSRRNAGSGMGLKNIKGKVSEVGGIISISSVSSTWQVTVTLPVKSIMKDV